MSSYSLLTTTPLVCKLILEQTYASVILALYLPMVTASSMVTFLIAMMYTPSSEACRVPYVKLFVQPDSPNEQLICKLGETAKVKPMPKPGILQRCCRIRFRCATHSSMSFLPLLVMKGLSLVPPALLIEVEPARPGLKGARCAPCCHRATGFRKQAVLHDASRL